MEAEGSFNGLGEVLAADKVFVVDYDYLRVWQKIDSAHVGKFQKLGVVTEKTGKNQVETPSE